MGRTMAEKILECHTGNRHLEPGDVVYPRFDLSVIHEVPLWEFWQELRQIGVDRLADPDHMIVICDHAVPVMSQKGAERAAKTRQLVESLGIRHYVRPGEHGIQHQLLVEQGYALPGHLTVHMDIHSLNLGAVGCLSVPVVYEFPTVMATGTVWVRVPETLRVELTGTLPFGVRVRDLAHYIIRDIGPERGDYRVIEFSGDTVSRMSVSERMILCGVAVEIGAKSALMEPDEVALEYVRKVAKARYEPVYSDHDARYEAVFRYNVSEIEPQVAVPPSPDHVQPLRDLLGTRIDSAYIGSCASGTIEELRDAAAVLRGRRVNPDVTLLIVPTTQQTFEQAAREGLIETFIAAGCVVMGPTCAPCYGGMYHMVDGEVRICTGTRNDRGRMGSLNSTIYLAGAATVAASAVKGEVSDPREFL